MDDLLLQIGVGGLIAVLMIREVLNFLRGNKKEEAVQVGRVAIAADLLVTKDVCVERHRRIDEALERIERVAVRIEEKVDRKG